MKPFFNCWPLLFVFFTGSVFSDQGNGFEKGPPLINQMAKLLLYQGYDHSRQSPVSLSLDPVNRRLYWRPGSYMEQEDPGIQWPENFAWVDAGIATDREQLVLSGTAQDGTGFIAALDHSGNLVWRYPSPFDLGVDRFRFLSFAQSDSQHRLFAAGARNGQSVLLVMDFGDDGRIKRALLLAPESGQPIMATEKSHSSAYLQVIALSENKAVAIHFTRGALVSIRLDKWFIANNQWQYQEAFCPMCSTASSEGAALKAKPPGEAFFYISANGNYLHFSLVSARSGELLDTVSYNVGKSGALSWNATSIIDTPVFLSARAALQDKSKKKSLPGETPGTYQETLARIIDDLSATPRLVVMNRGALLGISGQNTRHAPLVVNLNREPIAEAKDNPAEIPTGNRSFALPLMTVFLGAAALVSFDRIKTTVLDFYHRFNQYFRANRAMPDSLETIRKKRQERFGRNILAPLQPRLGLRPESSVVFPSPGVISRPGLPATSLQINTQNESPVLYKEEKDPLQFREQLQQNLASVIGSQQDSAESADVSGRLTRNALAQALAKVLIQRHNQLIHDQQAKLSPRLPDSFKLVPMPPDEYCFYHAIGQALDVDGQAFFQSITTTAQQMLQDSPGLTAILNNFSGGEGAIDEMAAMGHVADSNQGQVNEQVWGHVGLLPFLCWYLEISVVVVTPGTWASGAGALYFMPDGEWELIDGDSDTIATTLVDLHQGNPELLIMQHDGFSHWDVLQVVRPVDSE